MILNQRIFYYITKINNMKKIFLLLLLSASMLQGQSRSAIQGQIDAIATGVPNTALKVRTILNTLANGTAQTGDVKEIDVSNAYLNANFDVTGLGTNERLGWAICNGSNGTRNRSGRVPMQYSTTYPTLGATGGSADAIVVQHSHYNGVADGQTTLFVYGSTTTDMPGSATSGIDNFGELRSYQGNTSTSGVSGTDKNLQPYMVTLMIMKL